MNTPDLTHLKWKKSVRSDNNGGACVEVAGLPDCGAAVRDSKDQGGGPILAFAPSEWSAFIVGTKNGEFAL
ncbi:DUF397 domain-containing protein [Actinoplanes sp. NPDC051859]|uniref:DUF397 domain-containing protein n=1 Tax=Actinoplanes sp. NPDC051859 TaxID=3363909 RepID=UPI0037B2B391